MIIKLDLKDRSYDIVIGRGCLGKAGEFLNLDRKAMIVTDSGVPEEYAETVAAQCKTAVIEVIKEGEESKNLKSFEKILRAMLENSFTRGDCVVAVGGGVCGDLAGFCAASYMRGVDFYNIPTTVLSQVDSSIGGKTAVDLDGIKNIVGAFYQPKKVLIDPDVLKTLPQRQISNGLAEAVKMAMTSDKKLFSIIETENITENIETIIERSLLIKKAVVEEDEKEKGLRRVLNFGHTVGHGIESVKGLYHGECVALGMLPMCGGNACERLIKVLEKLNLPTKYDFDLSCIKEAITHDKKGEGSFVNIVTVPEIGSFKMEKVTYDALFERLGAFALEGKV